MYLLGTILIVAAVAAALMATVSYALVPSGNLRALTYGRIGTRASLIAVLLVVGLLNYLFVAQRYDIEYVYNYSSIELEPHFRVAAVWAGQPGSFVIWALWGIVAAQFLVRRTRNAEPYVLSVFMFIQAALLVFMLIRNPFVPHLEGGLPVFPADGKGLNPTLHNMWMLIHPPILFIGFALMAVPFAYAVAGIWRRDYDGWVRDALPWTIAAWSFLGLALLLGGYWAYETLGWGGYWGWDPVENSALVPWFTATALIHAMLAQRAGGGLRRTTLVLAVLTYLLVFYATFLTRSGVLSSFSVHSFVEEGLKWIMVGYLAFLAIGGIVVLAWRWRDIPSRELSEKLLSRDSFIVLMIICLMVISAVVSLGTSMPVISAIPGVGHSLQGALGSMFELDDGTTYDPNAQPFADGRFGFVGSFYSTAVPPLGLITVMLMIIGPLLGWRDTNIRHLLRTLRWPAAAAVVMVCIGLFLGARDPLPMAYIGLCTFAFGTNLIMIIRTLRSGWMRIGGYLAHIGLMLFLVGAVASTLYATSEERLLIPEGETLSMYGYDFTFNGWMLTPEGRGLLDITVARGNDTFRATPQLYFNDRMGATMATPSVKSELLRDVYISPQEYQPPFDRNLADIGLGQTKSIGPYTFTFIGFEVPESHNEGSADVGAKLRVEYEGQSVEMTPKITLLANQSDPTQAIQDNPVDLPGGNSASLAAFDPLQRRVIIRVDGLGFPVDPARAVVVVSVKPGVMLVWLGVILGVLGGFIAMVRRTLEGQPRPAGARERLPRGLGGLARFVGGR
ncbi:MAG TPA: cytochrome c biogenesis protein CcsA [Roseiflexaceae bacterium]|nr:cytochrome c biogenesis protein CcsA [Roseiflexaceae bacterium]HMP40913.1 cytochrome c biogenesis protein CcsA [Roseiflexaceae bacterium]